MAEKKKGLSIGMIIGSIAVGAAAGVFYYYRKAELKKLADEIIARVKTAQDADEEPGDWDIRAGTEPGAAEVNIVDSGVSLESVENPENGAEAEAEAESGPEAAEEAGEEPEAVGEAGPESEPEAEEDEDEIERPKKPWFWSK